MRTQRIEFLLLPIHDITQLGPGAFEKGDLKVQLFEFLGVHRRILRRPT